MDCPIFPNAQHVHVAWAACLLCDLERRENQLVAWRAVLEFNVEPYASALRRFVENACRAVDDFGRALDRLKSRPLPSPLGPWYPGRFGASR